MAELDSHLGLLGLPPTVLPDMGLNPGACRRMRRRMQCYEKASSLATEECVGSARSGQCVSTETSMQLQLGVPSGDKVPAQRGEGSGPVVTLMPL